MWIAGRSAPLPVPKAAELFHFEADDFVRNARTGGPRPAAANGG